MAFQLDRTGWLDAACGCARLKSPNFDERPPGTTVSLLVIHNISLPPGEFGGPYVADLFMNRLDVSANPTFASLRDLHVSAHFFIRRDGEVMQFVSTEDRAWHAGVSSLHGRKNCNDFSLGIEMEGTGAIPYTDAQYDALGSLVPTLRARYPLRYAWGHEDIAPGRKTDPGPSFDWSRFGRVTGFPLRALPPR